MPASACCSAITSGVAIRSVDLHSNHAVLDDHRKGVDGHVRRQVQGLSGAQIKARAVPRALDRTVFVVQLPFNQFAVVMRAAILDGEQLASTVDDADLEVLPRDETLLAGWELFEGADVDQGTHAEKIRFRRYGFYRRGWAGPDVPWWLVLASMQSRPLIGVTTSEVRRAERM